MANIFNLLVISVLMTLAAGYEIRGLIDSKFISFDDSFSKYRQEHPNPKIFRN